MPAKTRKRRISIPMQAAENLDMKETFLKCSWYRRDNREVDGVKRMVQESIDDLCASEDVEADKKGVVSEQHAAAELVCNSTFSIDLVAKIADVLEMTVTHTVLATYCEACSLDFCESLRRFKRAS